MPKWSGKKDVDAEVDYHGYTAEAMRHALERQWPRWKGLSKVRVIHGQGTSLRPTLEQWCAEMGIPCAPEPNNPGSSRLYPDQRLQANVDRLNNTLAAKGLKLTPEQTAALYDPEAVKRAREEEKRRREAEERKHREEAAALAAKKRKEELLWEAEMARLDKLNHLHRKGKGKQEGEKPKPASAVLPGTILHQEGYWRGELVRVADTDTDTLKVQKRTGLDKLAPPIEPKPKSPEAAPVVAKAPKKPVRDEAADRALFEAELARWENGD